MCVTVIVVYPAFKKRTKPNRHKTISREILRLGGKITLSPDLPQTNKMKTEKPELPQWIVMCVASKKCITVPSRSQAYRLKDQLSSGKVGSYVVRKMVTL
jgi:hypothetical protein